LKVETAGPAIAKNPAFARDPPAVRVAELDGDVRRPEAALQEQGRARMAELVEVDITTTLSRQAAATGRQR
jgi:hypothetical protein